MGLNVHIYPSTLINASRIGRLARSIQDTGLFAETHAVGICSGNLAAVEKLSPRVKIVRIRGTLRKGILGRILKLLLWQPRVYEAYKRQNVAVLAAHNVWVLPLVYKLSRKTGAIFAYNAHELETETINLKGVRRRVAKFIERRYIKHIDIVSVVNESIADWYELAYRIQRPIVVTNTPIDDGRDSDIRGELGLSQHDMLYIHTGNLVAGRNIPLILTRFAENPNVHVVFLGDGPLRSSILSTAERYSNIHWLPPVAPNSVVSYVRGADVGLCLIEHVSLSDKFSTPNKLMEPLAAGIPVLSSDLVEARRLLGNKAGTWVINTPEHELGDALQRLGKEDVRCFQEDWRGIPSWETQVEPLVVAYREVV